MDNFDRSVTEHWKERSEMVKGASGSYGWCRSRCQGGVSFEAITSMGIVGGRES
jgi:hypothetical protein